MKNSKKQLPAKKIRTHYAFGKIKNDQQETTTASDPTDTCGTVITTTHII